MNDRMLAGVMLSLVAAAGAFALAWTNRHLVDLGEWRTLPTPEEKASAWEITCLAGESAFHDVAVSKPVWSTEYGSISYRSTRGHMVVIFGPENCISAPQPPKPVI